jgi:hypothetical protein
MLGARSEARALTKRIPEALLQYDPSLQNCLTLLRAVWQTQHAQVYQVLRGLPWPDALQPLIRRYESMFPMANELLFFSRILKLTNYSTIRFLPRQDLDRSEQVLRSYTTSYSGGPPRS